MGWNAVMLSQVVDEEEIPPGSPEELYATAERLQRRTASLSGRTRELRQSAKRLKASTERLRDRLQSSFPPPPPDKED